MFGSMSSGLEPGITAEGAFVQCEREHGVSGWPILGGAPEAVASLVRGRCPICPEQPLDSDAGEAALVDAACSCCGSGWRMTDENLACLPGPRTKLVGS